MRNEPLKHEIAVINDAGDIEVIDVLTGEVVINSRAPANAHSLAFDYNKALMICQEVKQGKTLNEIALMHGMPPLHVISHWQRSDRMFQEELKLARVSRAEFHHEKILDLAKKAANGEYGKDEVPGIKLGAELYRWSAERANPERYGAKMTHEGSTEKPILMRVINTGINRALKNANIVDAEIKGEPNEKPTIEGTTVESDRRPSAEGDQRGVSGTDGRKISTGITRGDSQGSSGSEGGSSN